MGWGTLLRALGEGVNTGMGAYSWQQEQAAQEDERRRRAQAEAARAEEEARRWNISNDRAERTERRGVASEMLADQPLTQPFDPAAAVQIRAGGLGHRLEDRAWSPSLARERWTEDGVPFDDSVPETAGGTYRRPTGPEVTAGEQAKLTRAQEAAWDAAIQGLPEPLRTQMQMAKLARSGGMSVSSSFDTFLPEETRRARDDAAANREVRTHRRKKEIDREFAPPDKPEPSPWDKLMQGGIDNLIKLQGQKLLWDNTPEWARPGAGRATPPSAWDSDAPPTAPPAGGTPPVTAPAAPTSDPMRPRVHAGQSVTLRDGRRVTVTKVYPDGTFDYDE